MTEARYICHNVDLFAFVDMSSASQNLIDFNLLEIVRCSPVIHEGKILLCYWNHVLDQVIVELYIGFFRNAIRRHDARKWLLLNAPEAPIVEDIVGALLASWSRFETDSKARTFVSQLT